MDLLAFEVVLENGSFVFVTVLDKFKHHYTKEVMRYIRVDSMDTWLSINAARSEYMVVNEAQYAQLIAKRYIREA